MELQFLGQWFGVLIAVVSSSLGGTAAAVTLYLVGNADPITVAILRWGIGLLCLLPTALFLGVRWPPRRDWVPIVALGLCLFGIFFVLYNIAVSYTTAARASLALSTLPLQTMVVGALLGIEPLTKRKTVGVCVAVLGVFAALASGLSAAPSGAWRGELIMTGAGLCMAFYNVWSRPFSQRSSALGFLTVGMGAGAAMLVAVGSMTGSITVLSTFGAPQWVAGVYLGIGGGALATVLWVMALERATPTRVANTMAVNPIAAGLLATQLVGEPITINLIIGLIAVFAGIWIATTERKKSSNVRFWPSAQSTSGANLIYAGYPYDPYMPMSALPPKADMGDVTRGVRFGPNTAAQTRNKLKYGYSKMHYGEQR